MYILSLNWDKKNILYPVASKNSVVYFWSSDITIRRGGALLAVVKLVKKGDY